MVQACMHVVMMVIGMHAVYNDISMAMVYLWTVLDDIVASRMFLCLYYCRMLHGGYILYPVPVRGCAVCVPIRGSPFNRMLHGSSF